MRTTTGSLLFLALLASAHPAAAADVPCASEIASFCSDVKPGEGRVVSCLRGRWPELPTSCREALDRTANRNLRFLGDCEIDLMKFCRTTPNTAEATLACLGEHADELDATCRPAFLKAKARPDRIKAACKGEVSLYCGSVDGGDAPALMACLAARSKDLSPGCAGAIAP
jgi:Golgi apparatus protein 1